VASLDWVKKVAWLAEFRVLGKYFLRPVLSWGRQASFIHSLLLFACETLEGKTTNRFFLLPCFNAYRKSYSKGEQAYIQPSQDAATSADSLEFCQHNQMPVNQGRLEKD
jgi:hypothetical protein